jgi:hypothetical protein
VDAATSRRKLWPLRSDQDSSARRARHDRAAGAELLQHLALDSQADDQRGRGGKRASLKRSSPEIRAHADRDAGIGFAIPYFYNGEAHDYVPDFIVRMKTEPPMHVIIEVKGYDERAEVKAQAAQKWVDAVNADGSYGRWAYALAKRPSGVTEILANVGQ